MAITYPEPHTQKKIVGDYKFPRWTRRDFQFLADMIHDLEITEPMRYNIVMEVVDNLSSTNPNFDRERFIAACLKH